MEPHSRPASSHQEAHTQFRVIIMDPGWHRAVPRVAALALRAARAARMETPGEVSVVLADDRVVRDLNTRHRGRNKPTNVLTYERPAPEMVLALGVIRREAAAAGRRVAHHLAHLVVHGALHLRGHDHDRPGDARRMEMAEARILHRLGVPNPWKPAAETQHQGIQHQGIQHQGIQHRGTYQQATHHQGNYS
jgi:probable rRNA maturation factor